MSLPPRRWFQFRLSTWFVLVAILAWAMIVRPWWDWEGYVPEWEQTRIEQSATAPLGAYVEYERRINPALLYPALALAAFAAWKAAWAIVERRKSPGTAREIDLL